jgi:hypothetical protein
MTTLQQLPDLPIPCGSPSWVPPNDPVQLNQIVRIALDDPRRVADRLADWFDWITTHHEGSLTAGILSDWAYDPCKDTLATLAWCVRDSTDPLAVRLTMAAIVAGAVAKMCDDPPALMPAPA